MLFTDEAPLREPVQGVSTFTKTFAERGPRDQQGRSLREFDLDKRLFRYPLSYMIYSAQFDALPDSVREAIYEKLYVVVGDRAARADDHRDSARNKIQPARLFQERLRSVVPMWRTHSCVPCRHSCRHVFVAMSISRKGNGPSHLIPRAGDSRLEWAVREMFFSGRRVST